MGFLSRLFKSKPKLPPADLSVLKTDLHSHFIPGIDDGAQDMEDSLALIRGMKEFGYTKVITTPHVMSDYYRNTPEIILSGLEDVRKALKDNHIDMEIEAAAEYNLDADFENLIEKGDLLTFGDNHILFELPFMQEPPNTNHVAFDLVTKGYKPILAHVERYSFWHNDFDKIRSMRDRGVLLQLNINSLSGHYGPPVRKTAEKMVDEGLVDVLGSDCHHMGHIQLMQECLTLPHLHKVLEADLLNKKL